MKKTSIPLSLLCLVFLAAFLTACGEVLAPAAATTTDPNIGGGRAVIIGQMPTPAGTAIPVKQAVQPGGVVSTGSLTFTLNEVKSQGDKTQITYMLQGLPKGYTEVKGIGEPWIVLLSGEIRNTIEGVGGGGPVGTSGEIQVPALPAGTKEFTLVIPNNWTGSVQTWYIPVRLTP